MMKHIRLNICSHLQADSGGVKRFCFSVLLAGFLGLSFFSPALAGEIKVVGDQGGASAGNATNNQVGAAGVAGSGGTGASGGQSPGGSGANGVSSSKSNTTWG